MHRLSGAESGFASSSSALCFFPKHMLMSQYLLLRSQNADDVKVSGMRKHRQVGLPWWSSGQEFACQCKRHKSYPWSRKIPHATRQLSPCATTAEPMGCSHWNPQEVKPLQRVACALQPESRTHSWQLERAHRRRWRPGAANNKYIHK